MTTIQRFDPFREMRRFNRLMSSPFWAGYRWGDPMNGDAGQPPTPGPSPWTCAATNRP